jgi:hypothetical protein
MTSETFLSVPEAAQHVGLAVDTVRKYMVKGLFPAPDAVIGATQANVARGWRVETLDHWMNHRLGRGYRSDLKK